MVEYPSENTGENKISGDRIGISSLDADSGESFQDAIQANLSTGGMTPPVSPSQKTSTHSEFIHEDFSTGSTVDFAVTVHDDSETASGASITSVETIPPAPSDAVSTIPIPGERKNRDNQETPQVNNTRKKRTQKRKRRYGLMPRTPVIEESDREKSRGLDMPSCHYETTLVRRAVQKEAMKESATKELHNSNGQITDNVYSDGLEYYGDISLGMKLNVIGGKVIVQGLNALADGRASPAQLTGVVRRGDVIVSVNGNSLVNLPLAQLMSGLGPLSTANTVTGTYERRLNLRLARAEGLSLLGREDEKHANGVQSAVGPVPRVSDPAKDMFTLFPMVDQLSGMPLFDDSDFQVAPEAAEQTPKDTPNSNPDLCPPENTETKGRIDTRTMSLDELISIDLASNKATELSLLNSEFFSWNSDLSELLRVPFRADDRDSGVDTSNISQFTLSELLNLGRKAILGAKVLSQRMEEIDSGNDVRSFRNWKTTLSLYSRASTRRRYVFDAASLPVNFGRVEECDEEDDSGGSAASVSANSDDGEEVDGDEILLRLAGHDEIWRKQVVEFLNEVQKQVESPDSEGDSAETGSPKDIDTAMSSELGSFLFGDGMTKILNRKSRPKALPPEDVTAVLFDLTTKISATVPDEITAAGSHVSYRSSLVPFVGMKRPSPGSEIALATRFLLDEAIPAWLKGFRPLPWEHRRVLWPLDKMSSIGSTAASTMSDDSLTVDSWNTSQTNNPSVRSRKRKNLREMIEEQELNGETRSETCFLVTYFFTQVLLPKLPRADQTEDNTQQIETVLDFLRTYGSYVKMHTCLAYAVAFKQQNVIIMLLDIAKHDPRHREVMKQTSKLNSLIFYEPTMLSAFIQRLHTFHIESSIDRKKATIDLCASAYPDIRPWQVKRECEKDKNKSVASNLYYTYLSLLLHPMDGHDSARSNSALVKEWCELSLQDGITDEETKDRRRNFFFVAARSSSDHLAYNRDLLHLAKLGMDISEHELVLDLVAEFMDARKTQNGFAGLQQMLVYMRQIAAEALEDHSGSRGNAMLLKRVVRLLSRGAKNPIVISKNIYSVSSELHDLMEKVHRNVSGFTTTSTTTRQEDFFSFLADEAVPEDMLEALELWTRKSKDQSNLILPFLHKSLRRGSYISHNSELSLSLLRLRRARMNLLSEGGQSIDIDRGSGLGEIEGQTIWKSMSTGMVAVSK